uniref:No apical meristem-associated C-terminal domain-containing protein n=1 Tax=Brassica oleracea var. oleracea TaxID=109376 RepID=A0A0D3CBW9_BRAOL
AIRFSFGGSRRRRLVRWLPSATSLSLVLLEATELSLGSSPQIESSLVMSLGGSSPPRYHSVAHLKSKGKAVLLLILHVIDLEFVCSVDSKILIVVSDVFDSIAGSRFIDQSFRAQLSRWRIFFTCTNWCKWSTTEDLVLISSWLNTSKDPVVGNEQMAGTFWKRIASYYNASPKVVGFAKREPNHYDVLKAAHEIFFNDYTVKFTLEHAWRELMNDQKWCGTYGSSQQSSGAKRKRVGEQQSFQSSTSMPSVNGEDSSTARPIGVKAAKANKGKRSVGEEEKILQGFQQMWELKQKDLQEQTQLLNMKDNVNKSKLLDSLLARTEPLTELEVAFKNKLITEMLSMGTSHTHTEIEARKPIVCGLSAGGIIPPLPREDTDDDVEDIPPTEAEVVEISDEEEKDMVELSSDEYRRNMGYLIRVEEEEDDIAPEFRRMVKMMHEEEKKLREERFNVLKPGIKLEEGQSSTGDGKRSP